MPCTPWLQLETPWQPSSLRGSPTHIPQSTGSDAAAAAATPPDAAPVTRHDGDAGVAPGPADLPVAGVRRSPAPPDGAAPAEEEKFEPLIGEPRTVRRDHEQPMTNKTFQDILIEQLEAAAELGNADAMYQLFLNEKMCPEDPSKADEDRAEEYLKYAYENNLEPWTAMQIMRYSRMGL